MRAQESSGARVPKLRATRPHSRFFFRLLLTKRVSACINPLQPAAGWSSQVARRAHNPEVTGSNPVPATSRPGNWSAFFMPWPWKHGASRETLPMWPGSPTLARVRDAEVTPRHQSPGRGSTGGSTPRPRMRWPRDLRQLCTSRRRWRGARRSPRSTGCTRGHCTRAGLGHGLSGSRPPTGSGRRRARALGPGLGCRSAVGILTDAGIQTHG